MNRSVTNVTNVTNVSNFNGGPGGTTAAPTPEEEAAAKKSHIPPTAAQNSHALAASKNPELRARDADPAEGGASGCGQETGACSKS